MCNCENEDQKPRKKHYCAKQFEQGRFGSDHRRVADEESGHEEQVRDDVIAIERPGERRSWPSWRRLIVKRMWLWILHGYVLVA
jgi:hypothetical protein